MGDGTVVTGSHLRYTAQDAPGVAVIDIDRPQAHNALDRAGQYHFDELMAAAVADPEVRCLVLAGRPCRPAGTSRRCSPCRPRRTPR